MLEPSASRFWLATLQSGLTDAQALQACWDAVPAEKRTPEHIDRRLARQAVQSGVLTLWQAQQIIAGRSTGFRIDRYVLIGLIGQGGMGRVYLAVDSRLNRRVALKILSPERVNNPRAIARFHREAMVGAQLQHENLVRIYDEGESAGKCYLVMEYIEGKNIGQMIAEGGPIPPAVTARLGRQVALGLEHAQRKGLIHRDVNPYNILVTRDGTAKLTDLGLAIDLADQDRVTRDGATVGTFDYVSPEQARHSHSVDTRSDIYSLGCSLYHMLTGQVPFPSVSLPEKLFSHQSVDPEPVTRLAPDVPEGLSAVVARMMRKSPDDRYSTPLELATALEPFADLASGPVAALDPGAPGRPGARPGASVTVVTLPPSHGDSPPAPSPAPAAVGPEPEAPVLWDVPAAVVEATLRTPAPHDDESAGFDLGVNLGPEAPLSQRPAPAPTPPRPKPEPKPRPAKADPAPAPTSPAFWDAPAADPASASPAGNDEGLGLDLGVNLGPAPPLAPKNASTPPKPKPEPKAKPSPAPAPPAAAPPPAPAFWEASAVAESSHASPTPDEGAFGLDLGVNLGPAPPLAQKGPTVPPRSKPEPKSKPKPPTAPTPAPDPGPPVTAFWAPTADEPAPEADGPLGLDLGVNLGPTPTPAQKGPTAAAKSTPEPRPKPKPAPTPAPDPGPPVTAFWAQPADEPAPEAGDPLGLDLGVNLGPPPTPAPKASPTPPKPKPKPEATPKKADPPSPVVVASAPEASTAPQAPAPEAPGDGLFGLNLGPEAPLSGGTASARPKPKPEPKPKPKVPTPAAKPKPKGERPPWVVPAAAGAGLLAILVVGTVAYRSFSGGGDAAASSTNGKTTKPGKSVAASGTGGKTKPGGKAQAVAADIAVVVEDGAPEVVTDLATAMRMAIGGRGYVVLGNRAPLKVSSAKPILMGGGRLIIKAAAGVTPVLEVEVKAGKPFLSTRTESPLEMQGVTIVARYVDAGNDPPPVIDAGGDVLLDRCSIRVEGPAPRARAVVMEGGTLTASGCWFENFDRALDLACYNGSVMTMSQSVFVRNGSGAETTQSGWAVRMRYMAGGGLGKAGRQLKLDHCTTRGQGFLDFVGFSPEGNVKVDVTSCAVLADALVSWAPAGMPPSKNAIVWTGRGDQYDIRGQSWVVLAPDNKPMPDGPASLDAWSKTLGLEADSLPPPLRFVTDPPAGHEPRDFAVVSPSTQTPGADPKFVGPGASPTTRPRKRF